MYNTGNRTPYKTFDFRSHLTSRLILKGKHLDKDKKDNILTLIKSDIDEDLILAQEIMNQLAI